MRQLCADTTIVRHLRSLKDTEVLGCLMWSCQGHEVYLRTGGHMGDMVDGLKLDGRLSRGRR